MKYITKSLIIMGILTFIGSFFGCKAQNTKFKSLEVNAFEQCIADTSVVRLDVRTSEEYAAGHIANAQNIDVLRPDFKQKALSKLPKDKTIAVYCRSGKRSKRAAEILAENGFNVVDLNTGYNGWTSAGKEVVK